MSDEKKEPTEKTGQTDHAHAPARVELHPADLLDFNRGDKDFPWETDPKITDRTCRRIRYMLQLVAGHSIISTACRQAGLGYTTLKTLRGRHKSLKDAVELAVIAATDDVEATAYACAKKALQDPRYLKALELVVKCRAGWRETQHFEHTGKDGGPIESTIDLSDRSTEELERLLERADDAGVSSDFDKQRN